MQKLLRMITTSVLISVCMATTLLAAPFDENELQPGQRQGGIRHLIDA